MEEPKPKMKETKMRVPSIAATLVISLLACLLLIPLITGLVFLFGYGFSSKFLFLTTASSTPGLLFSLGTVILFPTSKKGRILYVWLSSILFMLIGYSVFLNFYMHPQNPVFIIIYPIAGPIQLILYVLVNDLQKHLRILDLALALLIGICITMGVFYFKDAILFYVPIWFMSTALMIRKVYQTATLNQHTSLKL